MPSLYNDTNFSTNYGSVILPISGFNVTGNFVAESFTITEPSTEIQIRNHLNEPAGAIISPDFANGSATLQISGAFPSNGSTFGFGGSVYYFKEVGRAYNQGEIYKASVSFNKKYN